MYCATNQRRTTAACASNAKPRERMQIPRLDFNQRSRASLFLWILNSRADSVENLADFFGGRLYSDSVSAASARSARADAVRSHSTKSVSPIAPKQKNARTKIIRVEVILKTQSPVYFDKTVNRHFNSLRFRNNYVDRQYSRSHRGKYCDKSQARYPLFRRFP